MCVFAVFSQVSNTPRSAAKRLQTLSVASWECVAKYLNRNGSDPEEEITAEQLDEEEQDEQKCLF